MASPKKDCRDAGTGKVESHSTSRPKYHVMPLRVQGPKKRVLGANFHNINAKRLSTCASGSPWVPRLLPADVIPLWWALIIYSIL